MTEKKRVMVVRVPKGTTEQYANLVAVSASEGEYVIDFALVEPSGQEARLVGRFVVTPGTATELRDILDGLLKESEGK